jgi:uncharacterized protein YfiM (DUF2279 family)
VRGALLVFVLLAGSAARAEDAWWAPDKALHFGFSAGIAVGVGAATHLLVRQGPLVEAGVATGATLIIGAGKELLDLAGLGTPSWKDFAWDAIGCAVGVLVWVAVHLLFTTAW